MHKLFYQNKQLIRRQSNKIGKFYILSLFTLFNLININGTAQNLAAYQDYLGKFYIFDSGTSEKVEYNPVKSFKVGGICILYVDNLGHLKMYYKGKVTELEVGGVTDYYAKDFLAAYVVYDKLVVVDQGMVRLLSNRTDAYVVQDSLVAFYDKNDEYLKVYYKGEIIKIESGIAGRPIEKFKSGDNIVAYISSHSKNFKIFYHGKDTTIIPYVGRISFTAGRDIVAYVDEQAQNFNVFYKDSIYQLEDFPPMSYKVGDGFLAYVDQQGEFKFFKNGKTQLISEYRPDSYKVQDYVVVYTENNYFKTFYKNQSYLIEPYLPTSYKIGWHTIAYVDVNNHIWIFKDGEKKFFTNDFVNTFDIYRDLIIMNVKVNRNIIYYKGKFYK
jgi:hypothetical protein